MNRADRLALREIAAAFAGNPYAFQRATGLTQRNARRAGHYSGGASRRRATWGLCAWKRK